MNELKLYPEKILERIKPLHGVGNGPLSRGNSNDISRFYKIISPPYARLHDTNFPESREVDIHTIFTDFSKDPDDPDNYDFFLTDKYLKSIIDLGTNIIYRLSETIATNDKRIYVKPPNDYKKYARICVNIIRHYNDGWADGFKYDIRHWEIWNEPSVINMWTGTAEEWLRLYEEIYLEIKGYDKSLMIGGPVACEPNSSIHYPFLEYVKKHNIVPDFYSFHCYTSSRKHAEFYLGSMISKLREYDLDHLPAYITEWNYVPDGNDGRVFWDIPRMEKYDLFQRMTDSEGAAHVAMFMAMLQDSFVSQANYYCVNTDSLFSCFSKIGLPEKPYYSLVAFNELYKLGNQILLEGNECLDEAYAIAASDGCNVMILISNLKCRDEEFTLVVPEIQKFNLSLKRIDINHDLSESDDFKITPRGIVLDVPGSSVALIDLRKNDKE